MASPQTDQVFRSIIFLIRNILLFCTTLRFLLLIVPGALAQPGGGGGGYPGFGNNQVCPPFRCSKGLVPVPKERLKLSSAGCNAGGGGGISMMSFGKDDDRTPEPAKKCCDFRNACYQVCGSNKQTCDADFKKCTAEACETHGRGDDERKKQCESSVSVQTLLMELGGCGDFDNQQRNQCECVAKDKAPRRRKRVLEAFYKKHAPPESAHKVEGLAAKADTTSKLAGLLMKLVKKYPASIVLKKDTQQERLEEILKQAEGSSAKEWKGSDVDEEDTGSSSDISDDEETQNLDEL